MVKSWRPVASSGGKILLSIHRRFLLPLAFYIMYLLGTYAVHFHISRYKYLILLSRDQNENRAYSLSRTLTRDIVFSEIFYCIARNNGRYTILVCIFTSSFFSFFSQINVFAKGLTPVRLK